MSAKKYLSLEGLTEYDALIKTKITESATQVKNELLNGAGDAYDTLKELGDLIDDNVDAIEALGKVASGKADATHNHAISDVTGLQSALDGKAASSHGTHVTFDSTNTPKMDGTAAFGTSDNVARADHVHPTDTSRASKTEFDTHTATHAPSNAQANVIESINVNGTAQTITNKAVNITVPVVDSALSTTSTNPVQNKIINSAIVTLTNTVSTNTQTIGTHTTAIGNLQTAVSNIQEITSVEIQALFA